MNIPIYDIENNGHTGYFNIVNTSTGKRYGEYITYEEAEDALDNNTFEQQDSERFKKQKDRNIKLPEPEYVVCKIYTDFSSRRTVISFNRGKNITDNVKYYHSDIDGYANDPSIKIYNSLKDAKEIVRNYNSASRKRGFKPTWEVKAKWW